MTLEGARSTARGMAVRFGGTFIVYRFPGWTAEQWGVMAERDLPPNVEIQSRWDDHGGIGEVSCWPSKEPEQGALF